MSELKIGKYQPYPEYKDSGSKWLDSIPSHWKVTFLKHVLSTPITDGPHSTPLFIDEGIPFVSAEAVSGGYIDFDKIRGFISKEDDAFFSQKYSPKRHDVYMIKSGATTGITAIVETDKHFNIWSPLAVMRCKNTYNPYFLLNSLRSDFFQKSVQLSWTFGTQQNIGMGTLENLTVCYPPLEEQIQIANFLDHETTKIDTLIEKQQQLIKLLKEKRQAVISHAVTKGLNPQVPMINFGVEHLGEVPKHWAVSKVKYLAELTPKKTEVENLKNTLCSFIPMEKLKKDTLVLDDIRRVSVVFDGYTYFKNEDLLVAKVTPCFENQNMVIARGLHNGIGFGSSEIYVLRSKLDCFNDFLYYRLQEDVFMDLATGAMTGAGGLKRVPSDFLNNFQFALPPAQERLEIVEYIKNYVTKFDKLMKYAESAIELMQERRTALISAAVTGKIDVRNWEQPND